MNRRSFLASPVALALQGSETTRRPLVLHYTAPAQQWIEALPVGSGKLGAMVFGGVDVERLQLNEDSLWDGAPKDRNNPKALPALAEVRKLLFEGRNEDATKLAGETMMGIPNRVKSYQPLGDLLIETSFPSPARNYARTLDLRRAVATTRFEVAGVEYTREVIASAPSGVIAIRMKASRPGRISTRLSLRREKDAQVSGSGNTLLVSGRLDMTFACMMRVDASGGTVEQSGDGIVIDKADEVVILLTAATSYRVPDPAAHCRECLAKVTSGFDALLAEHEKDHAKFFARVDLELGAADSALEAVPTDERLRRVQAGGSDPGLETLLFQYGRYLLIASSRPASLPANLQGVWNPHLKAPWNSDFHTNINLQMNYWPAEVTNLSECH